MEQPGCRAGRVPAAPPRCLCTARAAKQRRKGDRIVIDCQEQAYWLVNRPPVSAGRGGRAGGAALAPRTAPARAAGLRCRGSPSPSMVLSLQPGAPNVLEQGPERRNCHTTRVQLVSGGVRAPQRARGTPSACAGVKSCPGGRPSSSPQAVPTFWGEG